MNEKQQQNQDEAPINGVHWLHRDNLKANDYNPNKQAPEETKLLEISILEDGWTQPVVYNPESMDIVDGFHRHSVSGRKKMLEKYGGYIPCVTLQGKNRTDLQMSTIRHNRATGTHTVLPMAKIIKEMIDDGVEVNEIMKRLGMGKDEVVRLAQREGIPMSELIVGKECSKSWTPE